MGKNKEHSQSSSPPEVAGQIPPRRLRFKTQIIFVGPQRRVPIIDGGNEVSSKLFYKYHKPVLSRTILRDMSPREQLAYSQKVRMANLRRDAAIGRTMHRLPYPKGYIPEYTVVDPANPKTKRRADAIDPEILHNIERKPEGSKRGPDQVLEINRIWKARTGDEMRGHVETYRKHPGQKKKPPRISRSR